MTKVKITRLNYRVLFPNSRPPSATLPSMPTIFRTLSLWLVVSFLSIASATERLAVLELSGDAAPTPVMHLLSDKLRAGALEAISAGGSDLEIMDRESMAAILGDMGLDIACIEGQCEVETARNLRAAYVVSGSMIKLEGEYILTVKLHESKSGSLLAADEAQSTKLLELRQSAQDTGYRLLMKGLGLTPQSRQQTGTAKNVQEGLIGGQATSMDLGSSLRSALIRFESAPTGAAVTLDGNLLCQKTPCTKELSLGNHRVQMLADRYHPGEERVNISGDQTVSLSLSPAFGVLKVVTEPGDLQVQINGETGGRGSFSKELPAGRYEVIVESDCLVRTGEAVALQEGETRTVRISPPQRMAGLNIRAEDSEGNAQRAEVFADGVKVGEAPGRFKVPICIKEFRVNAGSNGDWTGQIALVEGAVAEKRVVLIRAQMAPAAPSSLKGSSSSPVRKKPVRLAVLELSGDAAPTTVLQQLSDKLRVGALEAIRAGGSELEIMTRESMAAILGDMGLDVACIEGQCEVETARNLRAAYVVSGRMIKLEGAYILTVKLHESKSGSLLGADETESTSVRQLRQGAQDTGYRLLMKGLGLTPQSR